MFGINLIKPCGSERHLQSIGDIVGLHRRTQLPGHDVAREVIEDRRKVEPASTSHLQVREIGLPELVWRRRLVLELFGRLHDDIGR